MRYRMSLIRRGEIEVVVVERIMSFVLRTGFLLGAFYFLYSIVGHPLIAAWQRIAQAF